MVFDRLFGKQDSNQPPIPIATINVSLTAAQVQAIAEAVVDSGDIDASDYADVTASRVVGTVYRNLTGAALAIYIQGFCGNGEYITLWVGTANPPRDLTIWFGSNGDDTTSQILSFIVPKNEYFRVVVNGVPTITKWVEQKLKLEH